MNSFSIPKTMRAVVYRGINDLRLERLPVPRIGPNEVLVRVAVCGVCPTDIKKIQYGAVPAPRVFGHETSGTIVKMGALVRGFGVGDRVALHHHIPCLKCHYCRHRAFAQCLEYKKTGITAGFEPAGGGYADYVRVMKGCLPGLVRIPPKNTFEEGAMLEPVNTVLKGLRRLNLLPGDRVLVVGQGPIGLIFTRLLSLQGVKVIAADLTMERCRMARRLGADKTLCGSELEQSVRRILGRKPLDAAVICAPSNEAVRQAMAAIRGGGQILLFAHTRRGDLMETELASICVDERDLVGSYSADYTLQAEVARLVFSRKLDIRPLITNRFHLENTSAAVRLAANPTPDALKIMVEARNDEFQKPPLHSANP